MRRSNFFLPTLKEVPSEAEIISHKLMLRAGLIRRLSSGIYSYLPLGYKTLKKIIAVVREEMDNTGALEILMPALTPRGLWDESGRWELYGEDMFRVTDRRKKPLALAPTHEEIITDIVRREVRSYKELPLLLYQIQTKFRDEARPRFGLMRCREFIMKDAYSFHRDEKDLEEIYRKVYDAYVNIFRHCGLDCEIVEADPGLIGGGLSHEFMVLAENGEDTIVVCEKCGYRANSDKGIEHMPCDTKHTGGGTHDEPKKLSEIATPGMSTVEEVSEFLKIKPSQLLKTLIYFADGSPVAAMIRGDEEVNEAKLKTVLNASDIRLAGPDQIQEITGAPVGFSGPAGLTVKTIADYSVAGMTNFAAGANKKDTHITNVNIERDFKIEIFADIKTARDGDPCPRCKTKISVKTGIEMGHTFNLGTRYSKAMNATFLDEDGRGKNFIMGCYGIGVSRILSAVIEQHHDENGIIWPVSIAPFQVTVLPLNVNEEEQKTLAEKIYEELKSSGIDVLFDDRDVPAGVKFKDADLTGIPIKAVLGERTLKEGKVEIQLRSTGECIKIEKDLAVQKIKEILKDS